MSVLSVRRHGWSLEIADDSHRTYKLEWLVRTSDLDDGPAIVSNASDLSSVGSYWQQGNEYDYWAICYPTMKVALYQSKPGEAGKTWKVTQKFSTKLPEEDEDIEDPLAQPTRVSGSNLSEIVEGRYDKDDKIIRSSSWEPFVGPQSEYKDSRPLVRVQHNVANLDLGYCSELLNHVNSTTMWGLGPRCIQLVNFTWEKVPYKNYLHYYSRTFEFEVNFNTFDRWVPDRGKKALGFRNETTGAWVVEGSKTNPDDFRQYKDQDGNNAIAFLDGDGAPATSEENCYKHHVQYHYEADFFSLGNIPATL